MKITYTVCADEKKIFTTDDYEQAREKFDNITPGNIWNAVYLDRDDGVNLKTIRMKRLVVSDFE